MHNYDNPQQDSNKIVCFENLSQVSLKWNMCIAILPCRRRIFEPDSKKIDFGDPFTFFL